MSGGRVLRGGERDGADGDERGVAAIMAIVAVALMSLLGVSLILNTASETAIAANFRDQQECLYAADAVLERAMTDLAATGDWNAVLDGTLRSSFADGAPAGARSLAVGGTVVDLDRALNEANCDKSTPCSAADLVAATTTRPWRANNPVWVLFAYGLVEGLVSGGTVNSPYYAAAMVADDGGETDGDPKRDGLPGTSGAGVVWLRGEAFGPRGVHKVVQAVIARSRPGAVRLVSWHEVR